MNGILWSWVCFYRLFQTSFLWRQLESKRHIIYGASLAPGNEILYKIKREIKTGKEEKDTGKLEIDAEATTLEQNRSAIRIMRGTDICYLWAYNKRQESQEKNEIQVEEAGKTKG